MDWTPEHIAALITALNKGELAAAQQEELNAWAAASAGNRQLLEELTSPEIIRAHLEQIESFDESKSWQKIILHDSFPAAPVRQLFSWKKIAVAASIISVLFIAGYFIVSNKKQKATAQPVALIKDATPPAHNRATLTLADGRKVYLDSAGNGELVMQGEIKVVKKEDGSVVYIGATAAQELIYNTLSNPTGSKVIDMTLADGSKVWLNAGSSITYPVAFTGNERKVSINGEAYFEIAHNAAKPFQVSKGDLKIEVLGTHFNVNAYDEEDEIKVTLTEGSVAVSKLSSVINLSPGQQAVSNQSTRLEKRNAVNLDEVLAWKNNQFYFDNTDIKIILNQLARWYNVQVEYKENVAGHLTGVISRSANASDVFRMLEDAGAIHLSIEGTKIIVRK